MSFGEAIQSCFSKYASFEGRASRSEYWFFTLFQLLMIIGAFVVGGMLDETLMIILVLFSILGLFLPMLSVTVRRLHDTNRSGWWYWISIIPYIGVFVFLIFMVLDSSAGENDYGYLAQDEPAG